MIIGFTGTQVGMTEKQVAALTDFLGKHSKKSIPLFFHHGDCVGADAQAHDVAYRMGYMIVIHPPINQSKRAWCKGGSILEPDEYLARNHAIVDACDILIVTPRSGIESVRSGTWATVRYAKKQGTRIHMLNPT